MRLRTRSALIHSRECLESKGTSCAATNIAVIAAHSITLILLEAIIIREHRS
jgi:hypothetical protein